LSLEMSCLDMLARVDEKLTAEVQKRNDGLGFALTVKESPIPLSTVYVG
jgi:hypothetical protein